MSNTYNQTSSFSKQLYKKNSTDPNKHYIWQYI